jgi:hypothetical protein
VGCGYGEASAIAKTTDGGNTWNSEWCFTSNYIYSVYFTNENTGYIVGEGGTILKTSDGGTDFIPETHSPQSSFTLYPNPATDKITISKNKSVPGKAVISILNLAGEPVLPDISISKSQCQINVSSLSSGVYIVKLRNRTGVEVKKLIIQ